jgi:hypothetical protein
MFARRERFSLQRRPWLILPWSQMKRADARCHEGIWRLRGRRPCGTANETTVVDNIFNMSLCRHNRRVVTNCYYHPRPAPGIVRLLLKPSHSWSFPSLPLLIPFALPALPALPASPALPTSPALPALPTSPVPRHCECPPSAPSI